MFLSVSSVEMLIQCFGSFGTYLVMDVHGVVLNRCTDGIMCSYWLKRY